jgi:hypothetical protein
MNAETAREIVQEPFMNWPCPWLLLAVVGGQGVRCELAPEEGI